MRKFKIQYSKFKFSEKPVDFDKRTQQYSQYVEALITLNDFVDIVNDGRCWRNGEHSERRFQKRNVIGSRFLALDFDESKYTPEEIINFGKENGLAPNVFYFSFSQGRKIGNNFRLVFVLDKIANPTE